MDVSDAPASEGVMVAFLPTTSEWCNLELPHMTLVYAGTKDKLRPSDFNSLAKDAASIAMLFRPFVLRVTGVEIFGDEEKVKVLRFQPTSELLAMRRFVESWNKSEHSFKPHVTIGPVNSFLNEWGPPGVVGFNQIMVGWGDESIVFKL
jgi:2'-5' RNA ligase